MFGPSIGDSCLEELKLITHGDQRKEAQFQLFGSTMLCIQMVQLSIRQKLLLSETSPPSDLFVDPDTDKKDCPQYMIYLNTIKLKEY